MIIYIFLQAIVGTVAGLLLAVRTKKAEGVSYGRLDKAGIVTNILLIPAYLFVSPFCMFVGLVSYPEYDGFLGILGWVVTFVISSATCACGLGLGASVALRKKGKSTLSFLVQFSGVLTMAVAFLLFLAFYGNLLSYLN